MKFSLKEIQSTRTQRPTASSSYPYVEIALGDVTTQRTMQLQLEQVGLAWQPGLSPGPPLPHSARQAFLWVWLQDGSGPSHVPGNIQPSAGDRANPTPHRTVGHEGGLPEKHLDGGIMGKGGPRLFLEQ